MRKERKKGSFWLGVMKVMPFLLVIACTIWTVTRGGKIDLRQILSYTPENPWLAAAAMAALYAVKSLSVVFPLLVLYVAAGVLFPIPAAIAVNLTGLLICVTLPYCIGRFSGRDLADRLQERYPKIARLESLKRDNEFFFSFFLRVINLLPGDVVSMVLGATRVPYGRYASGSLLGLLPTMLAATFMGESILTPFSPVFLLSAGATVLISAVSFIVWRKWGRKQMQ